MAKKGKRPKRTVPPSGQRSREAERASQGAAAAGAEAVSASEPTPPSSIAPIAPLAPRSRALANALILAFLAYQVAMPLRYYLNDLRYDERFSWRMFSTLRLQRCTAQVHETVDGAERTLDLRKELQVAWIGMLERYRRPVVDKLLARRCAKHEASSVSFTRRCTDTDGSQLPEITVSLNCGTGKLVADEGVASGASTATTKGPAP